MRLTVAILGATLTALPTQLHAEAPFIEVSNKAGKSFEARIIALNDDAVTVKTRDEKEYKLRLELLSNETVERVQTWKPFGSLKIKRISPEEQIADPISSSSGRDVSKPLLHLTFEGEMSLLIDPDNLDGFEFLKSGLEKFIEIYPDLAKAIPFPPNRQRKLLLEDNKKKSKPVSKNLTYAQQESEDNKSAFYVFFQGDTIGLSCSISMLNPDDPFANSHSWEVSDISKVYQLRDILENIDPAQELRKLERQSIELDRLVK